MSVLPWSKTLFPCGPSICLRTLDFLSDVAVFRLHSQDFHAYFVPTFLNEHT